MQTKRSGRAAAILLALTLLLGGSLFVRALTAEHARLELVERTSPFVLAGEYRVGTDGEWQSVQDLSGLTRSGTQTIALRGTFSREIPAGKAVYVPQDGAAVTIRIRGRTVFPSEAGTGAPVSARQNSLSAFLSDGISTSDPVEIQVQSDVPGRAAQALRVLLSGFCFGTIQAIYADQIHAHLGSLTAAAVILAAGFVLMLIACLLFSLHSRNGWKFLFSGGFVFSSGCWLLSGCGMLSLLWPFSAFLTRMGQFFLPMIPVFALMLFSTFLTGKRKSCTLLCAAALLCALAGQTVLQWSGREVSGRGQNVQILLALAALLPGVVCMILEHRQAPGGHSLRILLEFVPAIGGISTALFWNLAAPSLWYWYLETGIFLTSCLLVAEHVTDYRRFYQELQAAQKLEKQLGQRQIYRTLDHLQPESLCLLLEYVQTLCPDRPEAAEAAIGHFAGFLRGNMESLKKSEPVPFEREVQHLKHYLVLKLPQIENRVRVEFDIQATGFFLPPLTLQPLADVLISGLLRENGGTLRIASRMTQNRYLVLLSDNGSGREMRRQYPGDCHLTVPEIQRRLQNFCGGRMEISCRPGQGTEILVILPIGTGNA